MIRKENLRAFESASQPHWFALSVKPRHEKSVAEILGSRMLEAFLPLYRELHSWSDRSKYVELPLFPGYVFCRFSFDDRFTVLNTRGVTAILGARNVFAPITEEQIGELQTIAASGLRARPCPYLAPGDTVQVGRGPLTGLRGRVLRNKGTASIVVSVEMLQRSVAVELDPDAVELDQYKYRARLAAS